MAKSDYLESVILNHVLRNTAFTSPAAVYVALSTADPTDDGSGLAEPAGAWYSRQQATFAAPTGGEVATSAEIDFTSGGTVDATDDGIQVTHFAIMDAAAAGNMLYHGALAAPKTLNTGDEVVIAPGALTVSES